MRATTPAALLLLPVSLALSCSRESAAVDTTSIDSDCFYCEGFLVQSVSVACRNYGTADPDDPSTRNDDRVVVDVTTDAGSTELSVDIFGYVDGTPSTEHHDFPQSARQAAGNEDRWVHTLFVAAPSSSAPRSASAFGCSDIDSYAVDESSAFTELAFRILAFVATNDADEPEASDCAIFGRDAGALWGEAGCTCFEEFLATPPSEPCGPR